MPKQRFLIAILLGFVPFLGSPRNLFADDRPFEVSIVFAPGGSYNSFSGHDLHTGVGVGVGWTFADRWGVELRAIRYDGSQIDSSTLQLGLRRALGASRNWQPYLIFGASLESTDPNCSHPNFFCSESFDSDAIGAFAGGGVDWRLFDWGGLRFDGRFVAYDGNYLQNNFDFDATAGFVFRF